MSHGFRWRMLLIAPVVIGLVIGLGAVAVANAAELRTWTDSTGKFSLTAKLVSLDGDQVILERETGDKMTIPLAKLSKADQDYVATQKEESPFQPMDGSPFTPVAPTAKAQPSPPPAAPQTGPRTVKANWTRCRAIPLAAGEGEWKIEPPAPFQP